jgi:hypothetical protein
MEIHLKSLILPVSAVTAMLGFMATDVVAGSSTKQAQPAASSAPSVVKDRRALARAEVVHAFGSINSAYQLPTDANGYVINPTDYQRGGTN